MHFTLQIRLYYYMQKKCLTRWWTWQKITIWSKIKMLEKQRKNNVSKENMIFVVFTCEVHIVIPCYNVMATTKTMWCVTCFCPFDLLPSFLHIILVEYIRCPNVCTLYKIKGVSHILKLGRRSKGQKQVTHHMVFVVAITL
jgi:hypothetical protein